MMMMMMMMIMMMMMMMMMSPRGAYLVCTTLGLPELELKHPAVLGGELQLSLQLAELVQLVLSERVVHLVHLPPQVAQLFAQLHVLITEFFHLGSGGDSTVVVVVSVLVVVVVVVVVV